MDFAMNEIQLNKFKGCFFGSIIGDVLGAPFEFKCSGTFNFDGTMIEGGPFNLKKGYYTDDTSMLLCLTQSMIDKGWDTKDQCLKFLSWMENGYMSSTKTCFDIGNQTFYALNEFDDTFNVVAEKSDRSGNGAMMRMASVIMYANENNLDDLIAESTITTHNNDICISCGKLFGRIAFNSLHGLEFESLIDSELNRLIHLKDTVPNGYVLTSYYHALESYRSTSSYKECMIHVINKGGDTDTNACIAGILAGTVYGYSDIDEDWLNSLKDKEFIHDMFNKFMEIL